MKYRFINIYMVNTLLLFTIIFSSLFSTKLQTKDMIGVLDSESYQCTVHSKLNTVYEGDTPVISPYNIVYTYNKNGNSQSWCNLKMVDNEYVTKGVMIKTSKVNELLNVITIQESSDSTFSYRINQSSYQGGTKNPYKLIDELENQVKGLLDENETRVFRNMLLEEILDTRSLLYKLREQLSRGAERVDNNNGIYKFTYDNARIEADGNSWVYDDLPKIGVSHHYELTFEDISGSDSNKE